jgi:predicted regulator of Ras-like GTPase activity (Roadblock/LC7/MglB family)
MKSHHPGIPEHVVHRAREALDKWAAPLVGMKVALVVTPDGFEVTSIQHGQLNIVKLAAMTSSLIAMTRAVGRELHFSACKRLILDTELGSVVLHPVNAEFPTLLCFVLNPDAVLGSALWAMTEISNFLSSSD